MLFPDEKHHIDQDRVIAPEEGREWELPGVGAQRLLSKDQRLWWERGS